MDPPIPTSCNDVPSTVSAFVDAFVDYAVSGLFLPQQQNPSPSTPTFLPSPSRLVAVGDLHGDLPKSLSAFSLAGLLDIPSLRWSGGSTVAIQVGDLFDRGHDEIRLLYLLHRLKHDASRSGGAFLTLLGNHEVMNLDLDFRYVTPQALTEFERWGFWFRAGLSLKSRCRGLDPPPDPFRGVPRKFPLVDRVHWPGIRARIAALRPDGGPITSRFLAANPAALVVGDTVFVHGGLLESHVEYGLEKMNREARDWMEGRSGRRSPPFLRGRDAIVWMRRFSHGPGSDCERLAGVLAGIPGARRMVMGHTIQEGINAVCGDRAVRIDVGLSRGCGDADPEVLVIHGGRDVHVLSLRRFVGPHEAVKERKGLALLLGESERSNQVEVKA